LKLAYHAWGDAGGKPVVLVHGFPDDAQGWQPVAELLAARGYYAIAPYLRGYGATSFLSEATPRTAQQSDLATDLGDFLDAMKIQKASLIGHDWGVRATSGFAILHPERVLSLTVLTGYLIYNSELSNQPLAPERESPLWYQWYFQTERGSRALNDYRREIGRLLWTQWSPSWKFSELQFERVAESWRNPDFVSIVLHSYRHRYGNAPTNPAQSDVERILQTRPKILVPSAVLFGEEDPLQVPQDWAKQEHLWPPHTPHTVIGSAGHFMHHEKPQAVAEAFLALEHRL
jgi:pimeloyl-ACP methyl ester carboxylesterase